MSNPHDVLHHHHDHPQKTGVIVIIKTGATKALSFVSWVMPIVLMFVGWSIPSLREPISWPWHASDKVWLPLFGIFLVAVVWFVIEVMYAVYRNTTVRQLQLDDGISLIQALIITFVAGGMASLGTMQWWFVVPWLMSSVDAFFSGFLAINNAFQKNPTQLQKGE